MYKKYNWNSTGKTGTPVEPVELQKIQLEFHWKDWYTSGITKNTTGIPLERLVHQWNSKKYNWNSTGKTGTPVE